MSKTSRTLKNLRRFPNSPFPLLSNLESFSNTIGSINEELLSYGLQTRERLEDHPDNWSDVGTQVHLIYHTTLNSKGNRYLRRQYKRLNQYRNQRDWKSYWQHSWTLMQHSLIFRISSLNSWKPLWYKELEPWKIGKIFKHLNRILSFTELQTQIRNVWIESPKGKWRQLGIPPMSWRLYLHMLNMFISYLYDPSLPKHLYDGFLFGRGCKSWWENLLWSPLLQEYPHLLEVDLSSGFPNLSLHTVRKALINDGMIPLSIINLILTHLRSPLKESETFPTLETFIENQMNRSWRTGERSVHMGLGISPILFVISLNWVLRKQNLLNKDLIYKWYADDGSFYLTTKGALNLLKNKNLKWIITQLLRGQNPLISNLNEEELLKQSGIKFCPKKSRFVKLFHIWITPYISLGLKLSTPQSIAHQLWSRLRGLNTTLNLSGHTRGRSANPLTGKQSTEPSRKPLNLPNSKNTSTLNLSLLKEKYRLYFGLIQSYLYTHSNLRQVSKNLINTSLLGILKDRMKWKKNRKIQLPLSLYNSGSKLTELLIQLQDKNNPPPLEYKLLYPNIRTLHLKWSRPLLEVTNLKIPNPLKEEDKLDETDYFRKYSELQLNASEIQQWKNKYDSQKERLSRKYAKS